MRIHPVSFVLGLGAAALVPLFTRVLRPLAVEVAAAGMGVFEEGRRLVAEQLETLEDITAEARARRAEIVAAGHNGHFDADNEPSENSTPGESGSDAPARRRSPAGTRRRVS
jgi:Protein of unknown function (DUF5132)